MLNTVELELQQMNIDVTPGNLVSYLRKKHHVNITPDTAKEWIQGGTIDGSFQVEQQQERVAAQSGYTR